MSVPSCECSFKDFKGHYANEVVPPKPPVKAKLFYLIISCLHRLFWGFLRNVGLNCSFPTPTSHRAVLCFTAAFVEPSFSVSPLHHKHFSSLDLSFSMNILDPRDCLRRSHHHVRNWSGLNYPELPSRLDPSFKGGRYGGSRGGYFWKKIYIFLGFFDSVRLLSTNWMWTGRIRVGWTPRSFQRSSVPSPNLVPTLCFQLRYKELSFPVHPPPWLHIFLRFNICTVNHTLINTLNLNFQFCCTQIFVLLPSSM